MLRELLDLKFLEESARALSARLPRTAAPGELRRGSQPVITDKERKIALASLPMVGSRLKRESGEHPCISHDPLISNLQSALERFYRKKRPDEIAGNPSGRRSGDSSSIEFLKSSQSRDSVRRFGEAFSTTDIEWISCWFAQAIQCMEKKHSFVARPKQPIEIGDSARLVVFGDWGSGLPAAIRVAQIAHEQLVEGQRLGRDCHAVHLGDVYYSGWDDEYQQHVLNHWPVRKGEPFGSWMLNANHDMFSGGYGYFEALHADERFSKQQGSSEFVLRNSNWSFIGLDTAWEDNQLTTEQGKWALKQRTSSRGTVLLSHHYYFSGFEKKPLEVPPAFRTSLLERNVEAWIWGHEHRAAIYQPRDGVEVGVCLGHGGVPVKVWPIEKRRPATCEYEFKAKAKGPGGWWRLFGLAVLDCFPDHLDMTLYDDSGKAHRSQQLKKL